MRLYSLLSVLLLLMLPKSSKATECIDTVFSGKYVQLHLCQNYSNYKETMVLLYKARAKALDDYMATEIRNGRAASRQYLFDIYDGQLTFHHLFISVKAGHVQAELSGFPTLYQLMLLLQYCAGNAPSSFASCNYMEAGSTCSEADAVTQIAAFYTQHFTSYTHDFAERYAMDVWCKGSMRLHFAYDSLQYYLFNNPLSMAVTSPYVPLMIKQRYLLLEHNALLVYELNKPVREYPMQMPASGGYIVYPHADEVYFSEGEETQSIYRYSYRRNVLDLLKKE